MSFNFFIILIGNLLLVTLFIISSIKYLLFIIELGNSFSKIKYIPCIVGIDWKEEEKTIYNLKKIKYLETNNFIFINISYKSI